MIEQVKRQIHFVFRDQQARRQSDDVFVITADMTEWLEAERKPTLDFLETEAGKRKFKLPGDYQEKTEWAFARLMYPPVGRREGGFELYGSWTEGGSNWTMDYPRSDRHVTLAVSLRVCSSGVSAWHAPRPRRTRKPIGPGNRAPVALVPHSGD